MVLDVLQTSFRLILPTALLHKRLNDIGIIYLFKRPPVLPQVIVRRLLFHKKKEHELNQVDNILLHCCKTK